MESFVFRPMAWPALRGLSRNPLTRASDRIEAAAVTLAVIVVLVATAFAGALGTIVRDARAQVYAEQAQTRYPVVAIAVEDSKAVTTLETTAFTVYAHWRVNGIDHADELGWNKAVKAGDPLGIWVDVDGNRVDPPAPTALAATDAVTVALVAWLSVVLVVVTAMSAVRSHVNRMRDAQWEWEIHCLIDGDGGRTSAS